MYYLLPFRFEHVDAKEILVNEVGDYIIASVGTAKRIANKEITPNEDLYKDLLASFFISETPIPILIDNLAARLRTRKAFLNSFTALHIFVLTLRCNQNCIYCQASSQECNESRYDMTQSTMKKAIDLMFKSTVVR